MVSRNCSIDRNVGSRLSETVFGDSATSVSDLYPLRTEDLCSLPVSQISKSDGYIRFFMWLEELLDPNLEISYYNLS